MASFYDAPVLWLDGSKTIGRCVGNNMAWICSCGEVLLGPHEKLFLIDPCPGCGKYFRIFPGEQPQYVDRVEECPIDNQREALSKSTF